MLPLPEGEFIGTSNSCLMILITLVTGENLLSSLGSQCSLMKQCGRRCIVKSLAASYRNFPRGFPAQADYRFPDDEMLFSGEENQLQLL